MRSLLAVLVLLTGCDLYWNHQGDDDCRVTGYGADIAPAQELRNPTTGNCEPYYGGGGPYCNSACGPCPESGADTAQPDWGACYSTCNALDEAACLHTSGCLATYEESAVKNLPPTSSTFRGCFATAPSGPISAGACTNLDAQTCSRHDNCAMYYNEYANGGTGQFDHCAPEPFTTNGCATVDCGAGYHCQDQCTECPPNSGCGGPQCSPMCIPDGDICAGVDCGSGWTCTVTCVDPNPTHVGQCYGVCTMETACGALTTEAACTARTDCTSVYDGTDCTCTENQGCTCQILTYNHCE
jgi:hypothetical protein